MADGNRFSASIVNKALFARQKKIRIFNNGAGVIYSPRITLNCLYGGECVHAAPLAPQASDS